MEDVRWNFWMICLVIFLLLFTHVVLTRDIIYAYCRCDITISLFLDDDKILLILNIF